eukprot:TRINITY_DN13127_c0_g1_i1.p1 TRINITY_DN13127_c0_g1~~TRINITY_DN13127_c0_g1_i1.p1  ORF type:complete len:359 (+),score=80.28 TRINITY_DN13127_c0_g1_i1:68-1078(+)
MKQRNNSMIIYVKEHQTMKITELEVEYDYTVWDLKGAVFEKEGVKQSRQRIVFAGNQLTNERTLSDYSIQKESTLHLIISQNEPEFVFSNFVRLPLCDGKDVSHHKNLVHQLEKEIMERHSKSCSPEIHRYVNTNEEIEKINNGFIEYIITVLGIEGTIWHGLAIPFKVELKNGFEKNLKEKVQVKCLSNIHHPAITKEGECYARTNGREVFGDLFSKSFRALKRTEVDSLSLVDSISLLFSMDLKRIKHAGATVWDEVLFHNSRLDNLALWKENRHDYFDEKTQQRIELLTMIYYSLKKKFSKTKSEPSGMSGIVKCPKGVFYLILGFIGRSSFL